MVSVIVSLPAPPGSSGTVKLPQAKSFVLWQGAQAISARANPGRPMVSTAAVRSTARSVRTDHCTNWNLTELTLRVDGIAWLGELAGLYLGS